MNGIDYYDERPAQTKPTLSEILAGLSAAQRTGVLDAYAHRPKKRSLLWVAHRLKVRKDVTQLLYSKIEQIEQGMKRVMAGNWADEPVPTTAVQLRNFVQANFASENTGDANDFSSSQCEAISTKIVQMSKYDGSGTFTWYKNNVS